MSLADQSQVWYPTSVQVTVHQARNLRIKGKNGMNDAYAIMQVAKDKFSTSVAEKCVAPVWKEEATFDLPLFHHGNVERCTLYIIVNHRASVGLDKLLGQAVINLVELHERKSRNKTEWFKLVDKNGKADKDRGEVLLDIQFMRNNMSASMFDLSMEGKPRSRIGKLKDKIRGKKKDGFSDSASAIVPSVSQGQTDSEGEDDAPAGSQGAKKKSKLKTLFAPKSNLQRNVSQSMSTLGSLPEKNSTLSGSRSSGLNVDSPVVKKKFKFLTHKRTASSDSKGSQGPFSILSRSKANVAEPNSLCINGSHVYAEEPEGEMSKASSTLSLNSSDHGSAEDLRRTHARNDSDFSVDSAKGLSLPSYKPEPQERALLQQRAAQEEAEERERRQAEEKHWAEAKRLQEEQEKERLERARLAEEERLQEEARQQEAQKQEARQQEAQKQEARQQEARKQEALRQLEEARRAEEQKQQEEVSVGDRLSSLFGISRKKDEKKEEKPRPVSPATEEPVLPSSSNPFEEIPLSSDPLNPFEESPGDHQRGVHNLQTPSSGFPSRTAKVSAVKPSFSSNAPDMFSNMHNSMAPPQVRRNSADLLSSSYKDPASASPPTRRRAPLPPPHNYQRPVSNANTPTPVQSEMHKPLPRQPKATPRRLSSTAVDVESGGTGDPGRSSTQKSKIPTLPLPDYDTLYPKRIHGVQGQMRWDHIVAEVTQRQRDAPELIGEEVSVDEPRSRQDLPCPPPRDRSGLPGKTNGNLNLADSETKPSSTWKTMGSASKSTFTPPKRTTAVPEKVKQGPSTRPVLPTERKPNDLFAARVLGSKMAKVQNGSVPQVKPRPIARDEKVLNTSVNSDGVRGTLSKENQSPSSENVGQNLISAGGANENSNNQAKKLPSITPRQRPVTHKPVRVSQMESTATALKSADEDPPTDTAVQGDSGKMEKLENTNAIRDRELFTSEEIQATVSTAVESSNMPRQDLFEKASEKPREKPSEPIFTSEEIQATVSTALESSDMPRQDLFEKLSEPIFTSEEIQATVSTALESSDMPRQDLFEKPSEPIFTSEEIQATVSTALESSDMPRQDLFEKPCEKPSEPISPVGKADDDPFSSEVILAKDPWALPVQSLEVDDLFTGGPKREAKPGEAGMTTDDMEDLFGQKEVRDPFSYFPHNDPVKVPEQDKMKESAAPKHTPVEQKASSSKKSRAPPPPAKLDNAGGAVDPFSHSSTSSPLPVTSSPVSPEPLRAIAGDVGPQPSGTSGGKAPLCAWVSPSEAEAVTVQSRTGGTAVGKGGEPPSAPRRPHPVKPMSSLEKQAPASISSARDVKPSVIRKNVPEKIKVSSSVDSGPYSQLTQDELISLVVKQQDELSKKNGKILELEDYIDNLLVRVIEENPGILLAMADAKTAI